MKKTHSLLICAVLISVLLFSSCATSGRAAKTITMVTSIAGGGIMLGQVGYSAANGWGMSEMMNYMLGDETGRTLTVIGGTMLSVALISMLFKLFDYSDRYW